ncbi:multi-sensor hybrid histidine kinase [Plesiocystis pacifica SIR-1]|uniref:histidine kinase n=1 Tax=Plesiocystis pacifica SIR-1 TaxID=391625 RepID=A6GGQ9_9BACT|nr:response regulator [Plesiocystis pacifica]EDM74959.1 multi-sensor hybrid histidine kinase [Plesiocystis pacifica SIR-1]
MQRELDELSAELTRLREAQLGSFQALDVEGPTVELTPDHVTQILDSSPVGVGIARTSDTLVLYQNERCAAIFGTEVNERRYAKDSWVDPAERQEFVGAYIRGEPIPNYPARMRRKDGVFFWCLLTFEPIRVGGHDCILFWVYDITPLRKALEELERAKDELELRVAERTEELANSEAQLRALLESLADGVLVCDASGLAIQWNAAAEGMFVGRPKVDATLQELFGATLGTQLSELAFQAILQNRPQRHGDAEVDGGGAEALILDVVVSPTQAGTADKRAVFVLRDVTEQRRLEVQVQHAARMDSLGQLSGGIAHDFNNMLNGIIGATELLELDLEPEGEVAENLALILDTAEQAAELTRKLLAFSRTNQRSSAILDVHEVVRGTVALLRHSVDKRVEITLDFDEGALSIQGDRAQVQNALLNLGINANQAMPEGGTLEIATRQVVVDASVCASLPFDIEPGEYVELRVRDSGIGMDEALQARIFEPFFTTKEVGRGTGLGLSMVYATVESHGGAIMVTSEVGVHTTFRLLFPLNRGAAHVVDEQREAHVPKGMRVLIADDEHGVRRTLRGFFRSHQCEVFEASNGAEALAILDREGASLDLVVLDTVMPKLSGADALRALRTAWPDMPVLMISGYLRDVALHDLQDLGIGAFLSKPFRLRQLAMAVEAALTNPSPTPRLQQPTPAP